MYPLKLRPGRLGRIQVHNNTDFKERVDRYEEKYVEGRKGDKDPDGLRSDL